MTSIPNSSASEPAMVAPSASGGGNRQFVTLGLDREVFAVEVERVCEILEMKPVVRLPGAPPFLLGVIDVRGRGVPVVDLRTRLGMAPVAPTENTRILVLDVSIEGRELRLGLVADRVFEVTGLAGDTIEPPPDIGVRWRTDYLRGIGRQGETFVIVFDIDRVLTIDDMTFLGEAA